MNDGPGLRQRARETNAVLNAVSSAPAQPVVRFEPTPAEKVNSRARFGSKPGEKRIDTSEMTKPLGSFKKGTDYVPKTGVYKLHEGEKVTPAEDNPMNPYSKVTEGMEKPKKVLKEVRTRKAKSGGYIHEHHHTEPMHHPMEEHTTSDMKGMLAHMKEHMNDEAEGANENEQSGAEAQEKAVGME